VRTRQKVYPGPGAKIQMPAKLRKKFYEFMENLFEFSFQQRPVSKSENRTLAMDNKLPRVLRFKADTWMPVSSGCTSHL